MGRTSLKTCDTLLQILQMLVSLYPEKLWIETWQRDGCTVKSLASSNSELTRQFRLCKVGTEAKGGDRWPGWLCQASIPLNGMRSEWWIPLTTLQDRKPIRLWTLEQELQEMRAWANANPAGGKRRVAWRALSLVVESRTRRAARSTALGAVRKPFCSLESIRRCDVPGFSPAARSWC